jgi:hypothetical protein
LELELYDSEPVGNEFGCYREVKKSEADMWNNLCVLLVANDVECRIVDSYKSQ